MQFMATQKCSGERRVWPQQIGREQNKSFQVVPSLPRLMTLLNPHVVGSANLLQAHGVIRDCPLASLKCVGSAQAVDQ